MLGLNSGIRVHGSMFKVLSGLLHILISQRHTVYSLPFIIAGLVCTCFYQRVDLLTIMFGAEQFLKRPLHILLVLM